jgi:hypothetical protein
MSFVLSSANKLLASSIMLFMEYGEPNISVVIQVYTPIGDPVVT